MKKKILLIAMMVAVLACLFVLSISAETITYEGQEIELVNNLGDPAWYTGTTSEKIKDKESIVILKDTDGNLTAYPSYYLFRYLIDSSSVRIAWASDKGVDYSFINENDSKSYASGSIYYVELPNGITTCTAYNVWGKGKAEPNVVEFVLPDSVTAIDYNAFSELSNCKRVTMSKNVTILNEWCFYNSKDLEEVIFPEGCALKTIAKGSFNGCSKLSYVNLENCQSLKTLGDAAFSGCTSIDIMSLPDSLEAIGFQALYNLGEFELASDYLPTNLTSVGQYFLSDCQVKNDVLYFPEGFTSFNSRYCFIGTYAPKTSLTLVFLGKMTSVNLADTPLTSFMNNGAKQPIKLVFAQNEFSDLSGAIVSTFDFNGQKGFIAISKDGSSLYQNQEGTLTVSFENANYYNLTGLGADVNGNTIHSVGISPTEIVFCGGENVEISYTVRCNHTDKGWYRFHTTSEVYDMSAHEIDGVHYNDRVYQQGNCGYDETTTNTCVICKLQSVVVGEKATGNHTYEDDFNCETALNCDVCLKTLKEALTHDIKTTILYENGYTSKGIKTIACQNEGCKHSEGEEETDALFTELGYSAAEYGDMMSVNYRVNEKAISEYEKITGEKISYGVFAVTKKNIEKNDIFDAEGNALSGVIAADITGAGFNLFSLKITGFTEAQKELPFAMGAFVGAEKDGTTEYSYLQISAPAEGEKYYFATYNEVAKLTPSDDEESAQ